MYTLYTNWSYNHCTPICLTNFCSEIEKATMVFVRNRVFQRFRVEVSRASAGFCMVGPDGPRVKLFHMVPRKPGLPYESCNDDLRFTLSASVGRFRASRLPNRCVAEDLRRPAGSAMDESEPRRSASCFGASGMAGVESSPKTL